jgi:hypothetical protein
VPKTSAVMAFAARAASWSSNPASWRAAKISSIGRSASTVRGLGDDVHVHPVDEDWQAHVTYGVDGAGVVAVRPDGYLGLVSHDAELAPVRRYLREVGR